MDLRSANDYGSISYSHDDVIDASIIGKLGPGNMTVSIAKLLNTDYAPPYSQSAKHLPFYHYKAQGAEFKIRYSVEY